MATKKRATTPRKAPAKKGPRSKTPDPASTLEILRDAGDRLERIRAGLEQALRTLADIQDVVERTRRAVTQQSGKRKR